MTIEYPAHRHCLQKAAKSWLESHVAWFITSLEQAANDHCAAAYVDHTRPKMINALNEIRAAARSSQIAPRDPCNKSRVSEAPQYGV